MFHSQSLTLSGRPLCCRIVTHDDAGPEPRLVLGVGANVCLTSGVQVTSQLSSSGSDTTPISAVAVDSRCRRVVGGTEGGTLRVWDADTGDMVKTIANAHRTTITTVDYHPTGEFVLSGSRDTHVRLYDLRKGSCQQAYKHQDEQRQCAAIEVTRVSPGATTGASGDADGSLRHYDFRKGTCSRLAEHHHSPITSIAYNPRLQLLAAVSQDGLLSVWDMEKYSVIFSEPGTRTTHVAMTEKTLVAVGSSVILRWALPGFKPMSPVVVMLGDVQDVALSPERVLYAVGFQAELVTLGRMELDGGLGAPRANAKPAPKPFTKLIVPVPANAPGASPHTSVEGDAGPPPARPSRAAPQLLPSTNGSPKALQPQQQQQQQQTPAPTPKKTPSPAPRKVTPQTPQLDLDPSELSSACHRSENVKTHLQRRTTLMAQCRTLYNRSVADCFAHVSNLLREPDSPDAGLAVDLLGIAGGRGPSSQRVTLEAVPSILGTADRVLMAHMTNAFYVRPAADATVTLWERFRERIQDALKGARISAGVDLSLENRAKQADAAISRFQRLKTISHELAASGRPDVAEAGRAMLGGLATVPE